MTYYITFCCFTNNIFFIKYIPIMVMVFTFVMMLVTFMFMVLAFMIMFVTFMVVVLTFVFMVFSTSCWFPIFILVNKVEVISMTYYITFCCFTNNIFFIKYIPIIVMVFTFVVVMFSIVFMVLCSYYWISLFIFIYKMEMVPVSYDISCFCLTNNIFFIKYIPIFLMMFMCY